VKLRQWSAAVILTVLLSLTALSCQKRTIVNVPLGISPDEVNAWYTATGVLRQVSVNVLAATEAVVDLHNSGVAFEGDSYTNLLMNFGKIAQAEILASNFLDQWQDNFGADQAAQFRGYLIAIADQLDQAVNVGLLGIEGERRAEVSKWLQFIRIGINVGFQLVDTFASMGIPERAVPITGARWSLLLPTSARGLAPA
jgi:hypothetical protein